MNNSNGATPFDGSTGQNGNNGAQGYPQGAQGYPQNGYPQNGYPQNGQQGYPQQQWQPQESPKKKNFFVRHKILTGLLALCVVGGIASAAGGGNKNDSSASSASSSGTSKSDAKNTAKDESKKEEKKDALPAVGQSVTDGKFTFTVTKIERDVPSIGGEYLNKKAQGAYTLVHVTVKNTGTETQSLSADDQKAYDANGVGYEATSDGAIYIEGNDTLYTEINPGNTLKGILVFDAPKGTKLTKVRLHDSMFSNGVEASL